MTLFKNPDTVFDQYKELRTDWWAEAFGGERDLGGKIARGAQITFDSQSEANRDIETVVGNYNFESSDGSDISGILGDLSSKGIGESVGAVGESENGIDIITQLEGVLDLPVSNSLLRQFMFDNHKGGGSNTFRSLFLSIVEDLALQCVTKSFTSKQSEKFAQVFGISDDLNPTGALMPYDGIDEEIVFLAAKVKSLSAGLQDLRHDSFKQLLGETTRGGLNLHYYSPRRTTENITDAFLKFVEGNPTNDDLLKMKIIPLRLYTTENGEKRNYRVKPQAAAHLKSVLSFTKMDKEMAQEVRRTQADEAGKPISIAKFYKISFVSEDNLGWIPFMHKVYLPPKTFGFDSVMDDEFNMSGVYVVQDVTYRLINYQKIEATVTATFDSFRVQAITNPAQRTAQQKKGANVLNKRFSTREAKSARRGKGDFWVAADMKIGRWEIAGGQDTSAMFDPSIRDELMEKTAICVQRDDKSETSEALFSTSEGTGKTFFYCKHGIKKGAAPYWAK